MANFYLWYIEDIRLRYIVINYCLGYALAEITIPICFILSKTLRNSCRLWFSPSLSCEDERI